MAEKKKSVRKGGRYCVAGAPNNQSCTNTSYTPGISMHQFPVDRVLREKWVKFVQRHRVDFKEPISKHASLCSVHFERSCYENRMPFTMEGMENTKRNRLLIKGSIPTIHAVVPEVSEELTDRKKRQLRRDALTEYETKEKKRRVEEARESSCNLLDFHDVVDDGGEKNICPDSTHTHVSPSSTATRVTIAAPPLACSTPITSPLASISASTTLIDETPLSAVTPSRSSTPLSGSSCVDCTHKKKVRTLQKQVRRLKTAVKEQKKEIRELKSKVNETETEEETAQEEKCGSEDIFVWSSAWSDTETEKESEAKDGDWKSPKSSTDSIDSTGDDEMEEDPADEHLEKDIRVNSDTPGYNEPKFIVFYSMLLQLFTLLCFNCKANFPKARMRQCGTMVIVTQSCPQCHKEYTWKSQPTVLGKNPAGNILLSFGVLMAGASISKVLLVFRHMGLCAYSGRTYFRHQRSFLFPAVLLYWERYQAKLIENIKKLKNVAWTGDGRFDSMGHSAKYGVYTMFCTTILKVVHFELVQANETGGSQQTELEGAKRCFSFLQHLGLSIGIFVSDRHRGIAKWIRENCVNTKHYFDIWHVARSLGKKLLALSREKGCEVVKEWMKGIRKHLYWCATSTKAGFESLILAKWNSFLHHVSNKHSNHPDPLYKQCHHGQLEPRKWIKVGTEAYDKLKLLLTKRMLLNDIKKLSPDAQTSCLEGFHATLNYWHPKMTCFTWLGTLSRHILASLHFNENLQRETQRARDGHEYIRVTYPKFKMGEEVVREVACPPTYGYVDGLRKLIFTFPKEKREEVIKKYTARAPEPLNRQFPERLSKEEAVKAYKARKAMKKTALFPPESEQTSHQADVNTQPSTSLSSSRRPRKSKRPSHAHQKKSSK